jgi:uncharacterized membrane protein YoaK (UPF0700 family)
MIGGCVGVNFMYNNTRDTKVDKFMVLWFGLFGGVVVGTLIGCTFPVSLPILGLVIWNNSKREF